MIKKIESDAEGRLDVIVSALTGYTRSYIKQLVEKGLVCADGVIVKKCGHSLKKGDAVTLDIPDPIEKIEKKDIPVEILYEDDDIAVINKPQGLTVHPAGGNYTDTLVNALMFKLDRL